MIGHLLRLNMKLKFALWLNWDLNWNRKFQIVPSNSRPCHGLQMYEENIRKHFLVHKIPWFSFFNLIVCCKVAHWESESRWCSFVAYYMTLYNASTSIILFKTWRRKTWIIISKFRQLAAHNSSNWEKSSAVWRFLPWAAIAEKMTPMEEALATGGSSASTFMVCYTATSAWVHLQLQQTVNCDGAQKNWKNLVNKLMFSQLTENLRPVNIHQYFRSIGGRTMCSLDWIM